MGNPSEEKTSHYMPTPIPESRAYGWDELLSPTRRALSDLLDWLEAACNTSQQMPEDEHLSTSLLISGARGSGKTTVLLSAALALKNQEAFFARRSTRHPARLPESCREAREAEAHKADLKQRIESIHHQIIWLDPLDLEPLPVSANLLATLLVRVRAALDDPEVTRPDRGLGGRGSSSLLQESAEATWGTLDQLVRDASFMWEDISSSDARLRAEMQIKASEIFINFKHRFSEAMEDVARTLALPRFGPHREKDVLLVLPIDNVDRSIEHLYNIVKLTRMVTSRRLWFVLAAGHQEFQLFMERSFQNELITAGQAGLGPKGQDETLAIARRQAATTLRRALPPSYRIDIESVPPETAWSYAWNQDGSGPEVPLRELLNRLRIPERSTDPSLMTPAPGDDSRRHPLKHFSDLFNLWDRLTPRVRAMFLEASQEGGLGRSRNVDPELKVLASLEGKGAEVPLVLTHAAQLALTLPARTLQDLWHAANRESTDTEDDDGYKAVRVATAMLRNAIDESDLPAWASQQLLNRILRQDVQGRIVLDLTGKPLSRSKRTTLSDVLELSSQGNGHAEGEAVTSDPVLVSELHLRHFQDVLLVINDLDTPGNNVLLPPNVCGWLMLLHDLLMLFEQPRVLNLEVTAFEMSPELVVTLHELWVEESRAQPFVQLDFWWSPPTWNTFVDFAIFTAQWKAFLQRVRGPFRKYNKKQDSAQRRRLFRFIQAAWVENVCSVAGIAHGGWDWEPVPKEGGPAVAGVEAVIQAGLGEEVLKRYEQHVRRAVVELLEICQRESQGYDRLWVARTWLEQSLPSLALPEFAPDPELSQLLCWPLPKGEAGPRPAEGGKPPEPEDREPWDRLMAYWKRHAARLTRARQNMVRAVASRSTASESLRLRSGGNVPAAAAGFHEWLGQVGRAWFGAVEPHRSDREPKALQGIRVEVPEAPDTSEPGPAESPAQ